ncbi:tryptophan halogenase family protein [Hyalangium rubrum]|uniref:Tryptophan halogenase family protein n=1 Tax=Hyalangium rubrum TaxID=3103134 RepID=A0ABU5HDZ9_9BACT|nr:tryptophan halogenase family protein [Hyalangium sp. s54d21]MDY7231581.1 tryptophan halogenase family protein [Hyalangium sp. s54d21]
MTTRVVIVGGGTAGWMTASYLKRALKENVEVTLVESSHIKTVGVGEATFSTLKLFFDFLGLKESDWMPSCNGTYKLAIRYENWSSKGGHFYHPFQRFETIQGFNTGEWWLKLKRNELPFDQACFTIPAMCEAKRSPKFLDDTVFDEGVSAYFDPKAPPPNNVIAHHMVQYPYGYHFDASLLADFLMNYGTKLGARRIVDDVLEVGQRENGFISHVLTKQNGRVEGDLFIDCTGFRGLLINQTLKEPFIAFNDVLPNDSAVALQPPWDVEANGIRPYTTATALSAGWAWTIPLYHRNGNGYVYCSRYLSKEEAEKELRAFIGPAAEGCTANHIKMRVGRNHNSWVKNCVAIGLSSGFVEPLESTGIFFIQHGIEELVNHFPEGADTSDGQRLSYNKVINNCIDGVKQFLILHYRASDRADTPYWKATKTELSIPPDLEERLKIWRARLPGHRNIYPSFHGFEAYSWAVISMGVNYVPENHLALLDLLDPEPAKKAFAALQERSQRLVSTLPSHHEYLKHMRAR